MNNNEGLKIKYNVTKIEDGSVVNGCFALRPDITAVLKEVQKISDFMAQKNNVYALIKTCPYCGKNIADDILKLLDKQPELTTEQKLMWLAKKYDVNIFCENFKEDIHYIELRKLGENAILKSIKLDVDDLDEAINAAYDFAVKEGAEQ